MDFTIEARNFGAFIEDQRKAFRNLLEQIEDYEKDEWLKGYLIFQLKERCSSIFEQTTLIENLVEVHEEYVRERSFNDIG